MAHETTRTTVFNEDKGKEEDIKLYYSTVIDKIGITCGEDEIFITQEQFRALAYLMQRCFYTRDILNEMRIANCCCEFPYTVYASEDEKTWELRVEKE